MLIDNVPFTVIGVAPSEFFGVDPGANPDVYLPMRARVLFDPTAVNTFLAADFYWLQMMGRLRPGVGLEQAQAALAPPFAQWVASTAINDKQRANLPVLHLEEGAGGLDSLRRQYSKPLYVLLAMVGLLLAIACANTANLLLARATARTREMAVRLSLGAGRLRVIRQLLTESALLAVLSGTAGIAIAMAGMRVLTRLLANGEEGFTLHAELNWQVLLVTLGLALLCGVLFGIVPALQSTRPALIPALKDPRAGQARRRPRKGMPFLNVTQALVVLQVAISLLLLVTAGLFVRTLSNLQSIDVGFNRDNVLLFELNAPQAGYALPEATAFYDDLRVRFAGIPGVRAATLSHAISSSAPADSCRSSSMARPHRSRGFCKPDRNSSRPCRFRYGSDDRSMTATGRVGERSPWSSAICSRRHISPTRTRSDVTSSLADVHRRIWKSLESPLRCDTADSRKTFRRSCTSHMRSWSFRRCGR